MTEKEIIKGLECCNNNSVCVCLGCPLNYRHNNGCISYLTANALNLINRQKAEIEELTEKHHNECRQIAKYDNGRKYISDTLKRYVGIIVKQKAEIERLNGNIDSMVNEHDRILKYLRTSSVTFVPETDSKEAVEKFAEALKAELKNLSKVHLFGATFALVGDTFVDSFMEKYEGGEGK